jgi:hypothetical protein
MISMKDFLGDREGGVKVEESWSKDVPPDVGANAPVEHELIRDENFLDAAVKQTERLRQQRFEENMVQAKAMSLAIPQMQNINNTRNFIFFSIHADTKSLEYIGTIGIEPELEARFKKDVSGRFYRECLKKEFPNRSDYTEIVCFNEGSSLKELADSIEFMVSE